MIDWRLKFELLREGIWKPDKSINRKMYIITNLLFITLFEFFISKKE